METYSIDISYEEFVCRIPALFPYIEWDKNGNVETHLATDAPYGSYGKIVDNMCMPSGVRLVSYSSVDENEIPEKYFWNEENTILVSENENEVFSVSSSSYLRKVLWYTYQKTDEELSDAVLVEDLPSNINDSSYEHIKVVKKGMDGLPIPCSVTLYDYYVKNANYSYFKKQEIISPCVTYSYRTIITQYYRYKNIVGNENSFIKFVDTGIGLIIVDRNKLNLMDEEKYSEVPDKVLLSQVKSLLTEYRSLQTASLYYKNHYIANGRTNVKLAEKSEKYIRMGGDNMTNWLTQLQQKVYDVATEYKCYSDNKDYPVRINANLMLIKRTDVLGLETVMENEFTPDKKYYDGDLLTHEGRTYICLLDIVKDGSPNNYEFILKGKNTNGKREKGLFFLSGNQYVCVSDDNITFVSDSESFPSVHGTDYIIFNDLYYKWSSYKYVPIEVKEYINGVWNEQTGTYDFDTQHFVLLSELDGYNMWYDETNTNGEDYRYFENIGHIPSKHTYDYVIFNNSIFGWDDVLETYVPVSDNSYVLSYTTNSKLRNLRCFKEYVNKIGNVEEPGNGEDWLCYYKIGSISGLLVETDEYGNILKDSEDFSNGDLCYDLHAYGNLITDIKFDTETNSVTFEYIIGAHLKAVCDGEPEIDIDGNYKYKYSDFTYDETSEDGIKFSEMHNCIGSSISELGSDFYDYVRGDVSTSIRYSFEKFPFETVPVNTHDEIEVSIAKGKISIPTGNDLTHLNTVRMQWMQGLYHQPRINSDILIDRGNGSSFERHIRLGEVHTMEDFENYQNGGYYKISEN